MDPLTMVFYGVVCGLLGAFAPNLPSLVIRLIIGAGVGVASAFVLPILRGAFFY